MQNAGLQPRRNGSRSLLTVGSSGILPRQSDKVSSFRSGTAAATAASSRLRIGSSAIDGSGMSGWSASSSKTAAKDSRSHFDVGTGRERKLSRLKLGYVSFFQEPNSTHKHFVPHTRWPMSHARHWPTSGWVAGGSRHERTARAIAMRRRSGKRHVAKNRASVCAKSPVGM